MSPGTLSACACLSDVLGVALAAEDLPGRARSATVAAPPRAPRRTTRRSGATRCRCRRPGGCSPSARCRGACCCTRGRRRTRIRSRTDADDDRRPCGGPARSGRRTTRRPVTRPRRGRRRWTCARARRRAWWARRPRRRRTSSGSPRAVRPCSRFNGSAFSMTGASEGTTPRAPKPGLMETTDELPTAVARRARPRPLPARPTARRGRLRHGLRRDGRAAPARPSRSR